MSKKDIILSVDVVEPGLVRAVKLLSKELGRPLKGVALVHRSFLDYPGRPVDKTGVFDEIVVDYDNPDELQKVIKAIADRILVVTTRYEDAIHHFSQLVPFIPYVKTPTESSLIWSTEKPLMRDRIKAFDPKLVPNYVHIKQKDLDNWEKLSKDLKFPVIVKPGSLWSSFLVSKCDNKNELKDCLYKTFKVIDDVYGRVRRKTEPSLLIEEMMYGDMYSTDVYISHEGKVNCLPLVRVITANEIGLPGFYGYRCIIPTGLNQLDTNKAFKAAESAVKALNLRSTTAHVELFKTKEGWKIIELGARIGGYREGLYKEAYDIEHHLNDLINRAGLEPKLTHKHIKHARAENIFAEEEGIIESIEGLNEARKLKSVIYVQEYVKPGDRALFADKGGDLIVDAILSNDDPKQLDKDVDKLRKLIKINLVK